MLKETERIERLEKHVDVLTKLVQRLGSRWAYYKTGYNTSLPALILKYHERPKEGDILIFDPLAGEGTYVLFGVPMGNEERTWRPFLQEKDMEVGEPKPAPAPKLEEEKVSADGKELASQLS